MYNFSLVKHSESGPAVSAVLYANPLGYIVHTLSKNGSCLIVRNTKAEKKTMGSGPVGPSPGTPKALMPRWLIVFLNTFLMLSVPSVRHNSAFFMSAE